MRESGHEGGHHRGHGDGGDESVAGHRHPPQPDLEDTPLSHYEVMLMAVAGLLIEKGIVSAADMRAQVERMDTLSPVQGARLVARAWVDDGFRRRLLADSGKAAAELGMDTGQFSVLVMENTPRAHNLVVCTLCSCYPRFLLGPPPDWYKSRSYRSRAVREPRAVLAEFGTEIAEEVEVRVHDSTADMRYMVLPMRPEGTEGMKEEELARLVTRDSLIGVAQPRAS